MIHFRQHALTTECWNRVTAKLCGIALISWWLFLPAGLHAQWPPSPSRDQSGQRLPNPQPGAQTPHPGGRREVPGVEAIMTLTVEPAEICAGDQATLRWSVRHPRSGIAWASPIQISSSAELNPPLPDSLPLSGTHSFTVARTPARGTFSLTTRNGLVQSSKTVSYTVQQTPEISRLAVETSSWNFESNQRARWGQRISIEGHDFGHSRDRHQLVVTMHGRTFTVPAQSWQNEKIIFRLDNLIPLGTGTVQVRKCGGQLESNSAPITVYKPSVPGESTPALLRLGGGATSLIVDPPAIVKPRSTGANARDLSDHYGLSVGAIFNAASSSPRRNPALVQVRFSILTYNIAQVPEPFYEGRRARDANVDDIVQFLNQSSYSIVCLQEAFADDTRSKLIRETRQTFPHSARGPEGQLLEQDSGLVILSRFPIIEQHRYEFSEGIGIPDNYAAKGVLHVRLRLGARPAQSIDLFTTHTQSGNGREESRNRQHQFGEALAFIRDHSRNDLWILTGDMNVNGAARNQDQCDAMIDSLSRPWDLWREFYPSGETTGFTFGEGNNFKGESAEPGGERLDFILVHYPKAPAPPARGEHRVRPTSE